MFYSGFPMQSSPKKQRKRRSESFINLTRNTYWFFNQRMSSIVMVCQITCCDLLRPYPSFSLLSSTLRYHFCQTKQSYFKIALESGYIWKQPFLVVVWMRETEAFKNNVMSKNINVSLGLSMQGLHLSLCWYLGLYLIWLSDVKTWSDNSPKNKNA